MSPVKAPGAPRLVSPRRASATLVAIVLSVATLHAQNPQTPAARPAASVGADFDATAVELLVGRSAVLDVGSPILRVSLTSPDIADALVTTSSQLLVHGKTPGTISMFVWDRSGGIRRYEVVVRRDLSQLAEQVRQLFPGEHISVVSNGKDVVIAGTVSSKYVVEKAAEVAAGYVEEKEDVVNLLKQQEGIATNQVLLRVRFAEVSRTALTELGISLFTGPNGHQDFIARTTTQQFAAPFFDEENGRAKLVFSDFLNLFVFNTKEQLGGVLKALQNRGLLQSLAEPNLIAENGKEASFLAGGEFPYPVAQGAAGNLAVTIVFKEFGIRLRFTPTVLGGDLIHLKVAPEVSSLDFTNAVVTNGFRVPALSTRKAETEVELRDGQTFAIAGLLNNTLTSTMQKIPGIGDIPILGLLFRSKAAQKANTELVVMITPQIVRTDSMGAASGLPRLVEPYLAPPNRTLSPPGPWPAPIPEGGARRQTVPNGQAARVPPAPAAQPAPQVASTEVPWVTPAQSAAPTGGASAAGSSSAPVTPPSTPGVEAGTQVPAAAMTPEEKAQFERARRQLDAQPQNPAPAPQSASPAAVQPAAPVEPPAEPPRKLTKEEKRAIEKAREDLKKRQEAEARVKKDDAKRAAEQAKVDARRAVEERKAAEKAQKAAARAAADVAREQAKRDAELAKQKAAEDKRQAEQAQRDADVAKRDAEADAKRAQELSEAEARLKEAQAAYQAELDRAQKASSRSYDRD